MEPSWVGPLADLINVEHITLAVGGISQAQLLDLIPDSEAQKQATTSFIQSGAHDLSNTPASMMQRWNAMAYLLPDPHFCTILPYVSGGSTQQQTNRIDANTLLKAAYPNTFDADPVLGDGQDPPELHSDFDSGDGVHLNSAGKLALAQGWYDWLVSIEDPLVV